MTVDLSHASMYFSEREKGKISPTEKRFKVAKQKNSITTDSQQVNSTYVESSVAKIADSLH